MPKAARCSQSIWEFSSVSNFKVIVNILCSRTFQARTQYGPSGMGLNHKIPIQDFVNSEITSKVVKFALHFTCVTCVSL